MKTKISRIGKQSLSVILSIMMIVSITLVGMVSVNAINVKANCYIYYDNSMSNWSDNYIYFYYGKDNALVHMMQLNQIPNTKLYWNKTSNALDGCSYFGYFNSKNAWSSYKTTWNTLNRNPDITHLTLTNSIDNLDANATYIHACGSTAKNANFTCVHYYNQVNCQQLNRTIAFNTSIDNSTGSDSTGAKLSIDTYKFENDNGAVSSTKSTAEATTSTKAAYTGTTKFSVDNSGLIKGINGYTYMGIYNGDTQLVDDRSTEYTCYPKEDTTYSAKYKKNSFWITGNKIVAGSSNGWGTWKEVTDTNAAGVRYIEIKRSTDFKFSLIDAYNKIDGLSIDNNNLGNVSIGTNNEGNNYLPPGKGTAYLCVTPEGKVYATTNNPASTPHNVTCATPTNGTLSVTGGPFNKDKIVTVVPTPNEGYEVDKVTYTPDGGTATVINADSNGDYKFTMPDADVTVNATFKQKCYYFSYYSSGQNHFDTANPFTEVADSDPTSYTYNLAQSDFAATIVQNSNKFKITTRAQQSTDADKYSVTYASNLELKVSDNLGATLSKDTYSNICFSYLPTTDIVIEYSPNGGTSGAPMIKVWAKADYDTAHSTTTPEVTLTGNTYSDEELAVGVAVELSANIMPKLEGDYTIVLYRKIENGEYTPIKTEEKTGATAGKAFEINFTGTLKSINSTYVVKAYKTDTPADIGTSNEVTYKKQNPHTIYVDFSRQWKYDNKWITEDSTVTATTGDITFTMQLDNDSFGFEKGVFVAKVSDEIIESMKANGASFTIDKRTDGGAKITLTKEQCNDGTGAGGSPSTYGTVADGMIWTHDESEGNGKHWCEYNTTVTPSYPRTAKNLDNTQVSTYEQFYAWLGTTHTKTVVFFDNSSTNWYQPFVYNWESGNKVYPMKKLKGFDDIWYYEREDGGVINGEDAKFLIKDRSTTSYGTDYQQTVDLNSNDMYLDDVSDDNITQLNFNKSFKDSTNPIFVTLSMRFCTENKKTDMDVTALKWRAYANEWKDFFYVINSEIKTKDITIYFDAHDDAQNNMKLNLNVNSEKVTDAAAYPTTLTLNRMGTSTIYKTNLHLPYSNEAGVLFKFTGFTYGEKSGPISTAAGKPANTCISTGEIWFEANTNFKDLSGAAPQASSSQKPAAITSGAKSTATASGANTGIFKLHIQQSTNEKVYFATWNDQIVISDWANGTDEGNGYYLLTKDNVNFDTLAGAEGLHCANNTSQNKQFIINDYPELKAALRGGEVWVTKNNEGSDYWTFSSTDPTGGSGGATDTPNVGEIASGDLLSVLKGDNVMLYLNAYINNGTTCGLTTNGKDFIKADNVSSRGLGHINISISNLKVHPNVTNSSNWVGVKVQELETYSLDTYKGGELVKGNDTVGGITSSVTSNSTMASTVTLGNDLVITNVCGETVSVAPYGTGKLEVYYYLYDGTDYKCVGTHAAATSNTTFNLPTSDLTAGKEYSLLTLLMDDNKVYYVADTDTFTVKNPTPVLKFNPTSYEKEYEGEPISTTVTVSVENGDVSGIQLTASEGLEITKREENGSSISITVTAKKANTYTLTAAYDGAQNATFTFKVTAPFDYCAIISYRHSTATFTATGGGVISNSTSGTVIPNVSYNSPNYENSGSPITTGYTENKGTYYQTIYALVDKASEKASYVAGTTHAPVEGKTINFNGWTVDGTPVNNVSTEQPHTLTSAFPNNTATVAYVANWSETKMVDWTFYYNWERYNYHVSSPNTGIEFKGYKTENGVDVIDTGAFLTDRPLYSVSVKLPATDNEADILKAFYNKVPKLDDNYYVYSFSADIGSAQIHYDTDNTDFTYTDYGSGGTISAAGKNIVYDYINPNVPGMMTIRKYYVEGIDSDGHLVTINSLKPYYYFQQIVTLVNPSPDDKSNTETIWYNGMGEEIGRGDTFKFRITESMHVYYKQLETAEKTHTYVKYPTYESYIDKDGVEKIRFDFRVSNILAGDVDQTQPDKIEYGTLLFRCDENGKPLNSALGNSANVSETTLKLAASTGIAGVSKYVHNETVNREHAYRYTPYLANTPANFSKFFACYSYIKYRNTSNQEVYVFSHNSQIASISRASWAV